MVRQRSAKPSSPVQIRLPPSKISCRRGGIGRRAGLKIQCPQGRAGSTPAAGIVEKTRFSDLVFFSLFHVELPIFSILKYIVKFISQ